MRPAKGSLEQNLPRGGASKQKLPISNFFLQYRDAALLASKFFRELAEIFEGGKWKPLIIRRKHADFPFAMLAPIKKFWQSKNKMQKV